MILQNNLEQTTNLTDVIDHSTDIFEKENKKDLSNFAMVPYAGITKLHLLLWLIKILLFACPQVIFFAVFYFSSVSLNQGFLMVATVSTMSTMLPVFSLVLDKGVTDQIALTYPELYKELTKGRSLIYKTFFTWVLISIYQVCKNSE